MILPPSMVRTFQKGIKAAEEAEGILTFLEAVKPSVPELAEQIDELRNLSDHCRTLCGACLAACGEAAGGST